MALQNLDCESCGAFNESRRTRCPRCKALCCWKCTPAKWGGVCRRCSEREERKRIEKADAAAVAASDWPSLSMTVERADELLDTRNDDPAFRNGWTAWCYGDKRPTEPAEREGWDAAAVLAAVINDHGGGSRPRVQWLDEG